MSPLNETDRRLTVESRLLGVISSYGGQRIVADNPAMPQLVSDLSDMVERLSFEGLLPAPALQFASRVRPRAGA